MNEPALSARPPGDESPATPTPAGSPSSISLSQSSTQDSEPPIIPEHELLQRIGRGAYGEVWLARNVVGTLRAVKIVRRDLHLSAEFFEREFKGLQKFEPVSRAHDGLVDILTLGHLPEGAGFYYVMELADDGSESRLQPEGLESRLQAVARGQSTATPEPAEAGTPNEDRLKAGLQTYTARTLRHDLKQSGHLAVDDCIQIGLKLTAALAHLHAHGLVHRDVKPSNIIFIGGELKLADAGLVAAMDDARSLVGTAGYIAPEGPGTPQADLYALGKVLYEAAFGKDRQEFPALPADVASRPDHARLLELNEIIATACAHDPHQRYATADALLADLRHLAEGHSVKRRQAWQQTRRLALRLGAAAAVIMAAWFLFDRFNESNLQRSNASAPASIFILPFRYDGTNGVASGLGPALGARLNDAFINSLKLIEGVTVAPRRSALAKLPEAEARAEAARLFGVRYVLGGTLKDGNSLTLSLALHQIGRDRSVWTQKFVGDTNRLIELEEQAIRAVAAALKTPIPPDTAQRINQVLTNNLAAWRLVQQADSEYRAGDRESWNLALQHYNDALLLDPDYLGGLAAKAQFLRGNSTDRAPNDIWPEIKGLAARMLQIDPTMWAGQYFAWLPQFLYDWDWTAAEKTFQERRARNADWPVMTAIYLRTAGRLGEARAEQEKVKGLDQSNMVVSGHSMSAALVERDYRLALELARKNRAMFPETLSGWDALFHAHYHLGEFEPALEAIRKLRQASGDPMYVALEGCALAKMGQTVTARKMLADLEARSADRYVDAYPLAWLHLALGDRRGALAQLRKACRQRSELVVFPDYPAGLRTDPKLDELRDEPEFHEILKLAGMDVWPKPALGK